MRPVGGGFERPTPYKVHHGMCNAIVRCMEHWEPPTLACIAVYRCVSSVNDLWVVRRCVMFGDVALDSLRYWGGGGRLDTEAVRFRL